MNGNIEHSTDDDFETSQIQRRTMLDAYKQTIESTDDEHERIGALIRYLDEITPPLSGGYFQIPEFQMLIDHGEAAIQPLFRAAYKLDLYKIEAIQRIAMNEGDPVELWPDEMSTVEVAKNGVIAWGARRDHGLSSYFQQLRPTPSQMEIRFDELGQDNIIGFNELKNMTDEEANDTIEAIKSRIHENTKSHDGTISDAWWDRYDDIQLLNEFYDWRKHGVPDRNVPYADWQNHMKSLIHANRQRDPSYGIITDDVRQKFTDDEWTAVCSFMDYVDATQERYIERQYVLHESDFDIFIDFKKINFEDLVTKGLLDRFTQEPRGMFKNPSTGYVLASPFINKVLYDYFIDETNEE